MKPVDADSVGRLVEALVLQGICGRHIGPQVVQWLVDRARHGNPLVLDGGWVQLTKEIGWHADDLRVKQVRSCVIRMGTSCFKWRDGQGNLLSYVEHIGDLGKPLRISFSSLMIDGGVGYVF